MNFGRNYEYAAQLLNLAKDIAAFDHVYLVASGVLPDTVREWQQRARDLVTKMDN